MKTVKRIIAVILLVLTAALIGYLFFTGSRLSAALDIEENTVLERVI